MDWLSRLFEMMPVRGRLDLRCSYGAPWRIDQGPGDANEIPYHAVVGGSAMLEDPGGGKPLCLETGDILLLPGNPRHVMHDGGGVRPKPARNRQELNLVISENAGTGERLDLLCGHFAIAPPHDRLLRAYLPPRLVVHARGQDGGENATQLAGLVALLRGESADDRLGGRAMLNALSTAMFALVLRLASETEDAPRGRAWRRQWPPCSTSLRAHGRCPTWRACATCHVRRSPANSRRSSGDRPPIFLSTSG